MSWDEDKPDLIARLDGIHAQLNDLPEAWNRRLTDACNAVRSQAHNRITGVEADLRGAITGLQTRLDIAVVLLACLLGVVGWNAWHSAAAAHNSTNVHVSSEQRLEELVEVVMTLDGSDTTQWTAGGLPRIDVLETGLGQRLGYPVRVTCAERRLAMTMAKGVGYGGH